MINFGMNKIGLTIFSAFGILLIVGKMTYNVFSVISHRVPVIETIFNEGLFVYLMIFVFLVLTNRISLNNEKEDNK